jgi:hypothetical protein
MWAEESSTLIGLNLMAVYEQATQLEVGKVTLKSNDNEALSDEFLLKSNGDEAFNDVFL